MYLTIGEFARVTHLSIKTLRHYHRVGLLEPVEVDAFSGYRYYSTGQVPAALTIKRFRDLDMPVEHLRAVLAAPDTDSRNALIAEHLQQMQAQLKHTQDTVAALQTLLTNPVSSISVQRRMAAPMRAVAASAVVDRSELARWWSDTLDGLFDSLALQGIEPIGPAGGLFDNELFEVDRGKAVVYIPVEKGTFTVPGTELVSAVHCGPLTGMDRTYGAVGTYVAEHGLAGNGPVREIYVRSGRETRDSAQWRTEIAWPVVGGMIESREDVG